jgi:hypothetical protein
MVDLETALKEEFGIGPEPPEIVARCQKNGYPKGSFNPNRIPGSGNWLFPTDPKFKKQ